MTQRQKPSSRKQAGPTEIVGVVHPLAQLKPVPETDAQTKEAVGDWHYWRSMGYEY